MSGKPYYIDINPQIPGMIIEPTMFLICTYYVPGSILETLNVDYTLLIIIKMGCYHHLKVEETEARTSALAQVTGWWSWDLNPHSSALHLWS